MAEGAQAASRGEAWVEPHGGLDAIVALATSGDVSAFVLVRAKLLDRARLTAFPLSIVLVPQLVELLSRKVTFYGLTVMLAASRIVRGKEEPGRGLRSLVSGRENARFVELLTLTRTATAA